MIDRREELERLHEAADQAPQLVVMRGRRRVGKSYLLDRSFADRRLVYFQADEGETRGHLDFLAGELGRLINIPVAFADWNEALSALGEQARQQPLVVVLDEFQWMLSAEPLLDSIVMRHFDRWERERVPIVLVISGSALSMMEQLLGGGRPMFGRAGYRPSAALRLSRRLPVCRREERHAEASALRSPRRNRPISGMGRRLVDSRDHPAQDPDQGRAFV